MARRDATVSAVAMVGATLALASCGDRAAVTPRASVLRALVPLPATSNVTTFALPTGTSLEPHGPVAAASAPRRITLPYAEIGGHLGNTPETLALEFGAKKGQVLEVRFEQAAASPESTAASAAPIAALPELVAPVPSEAQQAPELRVLIVDSGRAAPRRAELAVKPAGAAEFFLRLPADADYVVELRPPRNGLYRLALELRAPLPFPVMGYDYTAIRSYFGASRESGNRRHEGVDIFVPRLTPVVAVADGMVGLHVEGRGGIAVVLSVPGTSYYYAHLDRTAVGEGQRVRIGDVLGYVGSTGNARGSAPHLHFGVYEFGKGAVDPLPLLEERRLAAEEGVDDETRVLAAGAGAETPSMEIAGAALLAAVAGGCASSFFSTAAAAAATSAWSFGGELRLGLAPNGAAVLCTDGT